MQTPQGGVRNYQTPGKRATSFPTGTGPRTHCCGRSSRGLPWPRTRRLPHRSDPRPLQPGANVSNHRQPDPSGVIVRKYGGSSLASVPRIREVARNIKLARERGHGVVVVVSAMGTTTDELAALARSAHPAPPRRELDMLLSVGERITMSLLSMALADLDCPAISFTGSQCGIVTDTSHTDARILEVKGDRVREALAGGAVVVVAGFQGVSRKREITTLGRGGSDTTAVALAATLGAVRCEILKDVDGVMTADPSLVPEAWRHEQLDYSQMRQLAESGCGVVHVRAVEYAERHGVRLVVRSSFHDGDGTAIDEHGAPSPRTAAEAPCDRHNRYRPLVMHLRRGLTRLRIATTDPDQADIWRGIILRNWDPAGAVAEWLDSGRDLRWEVMADAADLAPVWERLVGDGEESPDGCARTEGLTCVSLAGGRPDSWLEVERHLAGVLEELSAPARRLRADGNALRIIFRQAIPDRLAQELHHRLIPKA
ncbi:MAG: aspartate kinase [bacterium]|nr:aspartate kinase [bacterium]